MAAILTPRVIPDVSDLLHVSDQSHGNIVYCEHERRIYVRMGAAWATEGADAVMLAQEQDDVFDKAVRAAVLACQGWRVEKLHDPKLDFEHWVHLLCQVETRTGRLHLLSEMLTNHHIGHQFFFKGDTSSIAVPMSGGNADDPENLKYVIGAHLDSVPGTPGANDNAAACAVLLGLALKQGHDSPSPEGTTLFFFDKEEPYWGAGFSGSFHIANMMINVGAKPEMVLVLDSIGRGRKLFVSENSMCWDMRAEIANHIPDMRETPMSDNVHMAEAGVRSILVSQLPADEWESPYPRTWRLHHTPYDHPSSVSDEAMLNCYTAVNDYLVEKWCKVPGNYVTPPF